MGSSPPPTDGTGPEPLAPVVAALLVLSAALAGVGGVAAAPADDHHRSLAQEDDPDGNRTLDPADEAYVYGNGTAVLVYESDAEDLRKGEFGLDVSRGLFHTLAVTETDGEFNGSLAATAVLEQDRLLANASMTANKPRTLRSLSVDVTGEATDEASSMDATVAATVVSERSGSLRLVESAETSGRVVTTGEAFATSGSASVALASSLGEPAHHEFSLTEGERGYTLTASQNYTVSPHARDRWNTSERATASLDAMYGAVARRLGGRADVTLASYSFTEAGSGYRLDVAYTVEYTGVDEGLSRTVAQSLVSSEEYDLTRAEARKVGDSVAAIRVDHVDVSFDRTAAGADASWDARVENYDEAVLSFVEVARSMEGPSAGLDRARRQFEARQAANLTRTFTWSASLTKPSRPELKLTAEFHADTENWAAYRDALAERGIDPASVTYELHARTEGEQVTATARFEVRREGLVDDAVGVLLNASNDTGDGLDPQTREALEAFRRAELRRARMDVSLDEGTGTIEVGAKFDDLSAFRDVLAASGDAPAVTAVAGEVRNETTKSYVYVEGLPENATESELRSLSYVGEDTVLHMPGTFDRSFPRPDDEAARDYLGLSPTPTPAPGGGTDAGGPGFGVAVGLAAVAAALLARR